MKYVVVCRKEVEGIEAPAYVLGPFPSVVSANRWVELDTCTAEHTIRTLRPVVLPPVVLPT